MCRQHGAPPRSACVCTLFPLSLCMCFILIDRSICACVRTCVRACKIIALSCWKKYISIHMVCCSVEELPPS